MTFFDGALHWAMAPGLGIYKKKKREKRKHDTRTKKIRIRPPKKLAEENTHSTKKASTKKRFRSRKEALVHEKKKFLN